MAVKLKTEITFQSTKVPPCYISKESFTQCHGNETVTKSANANTVNGIVNGINNVPMQLIEQKSSAESFGANVGNCSRDFHPGTDIEDAKALFEETQETVQGNMINTDPPQVTGKQDTDTGREPECIVGNWKFLKENINPDYIRADLISTELIDRDDCDGGGYHDKSRQCKIYHLLTSVIRNIGSTSDLEKFIHIFETDQKFIADKLKLPIEVPDWSKGVKNVEKCRHRLATNRKLVEKELKKPQKLFDDFLENFVFDIHDHEKLCNLTGGRKKLAECFMDKVLTSVEKGSYDLLLHILKTEMCNVPHVYQRIVEELEKTPDQSVPEMSMCINLKSGKLYKSNEDNTPRTDVSEGCTFTITIKGDARCEHQIKENAMRMEAILVREFGALTTHVTDGSVVIHLKSVDGDIISRLTDSIRRGQFVRLIEELFSCHEANSRIPSGHWSVDFIIELDNSSSKMTLPATPLKFVVKTGDHRLQLLHANKAFLQEEIDPLTLLEAFSKRGFDHFKEANIEIISERKLRTDKFLDILEKESDQLMNVFIEILEDQKMNFVLKRLKVYQKMQTIGAALLKKNILKHIESIIDEVDLEDIKDEIISQYGLHEDMLEELYSQYPEGSEGRIVAMIVDILGQGDSAVCMFIDILFNSGIDSSLLEELSDIEQVSVDIDCVGDNAFVVIREVPKRGLIFQCEVEVIVEVKDGKSKSNTESILHNWKTLKQSIEPVDFVPELERCNFLPKSSFENLGSKSQLHQATLVLIKVYRQVQSSEKEYQKFVEILRRYNGIAADALSNAVGGPINKSETVDQHLIEQTRDLLKRFEKKIKDKLKRNPDVVLEITDNFIECGLLDIDTVENILHSPKEAAQLLVEFVITNIHLGAYNRLLETLKSETIFRGLVSDLTTAGDREDVNTGTTLQPSATLLSGLFDLPNISQKQSEQQTTESVQHTMNETIIAANRSFLIQTINTMALGRAFKNQGITCFDDLDGTLGRQQRAEHFLNILQKNNLLDQLLDILREQGMTYVLDRLNNCRNAYSADPHILRRNFSNNHSNILDNLDIDDVREIFIKRKVFSSSMFNGIEKKYSRRSGKQMSAVLIEITNSGPRAMRTLVDVLYINQLDSLADSLLKGTLNELQEMKGCTQTGDPIWLERASDPLPKSVDQKLLETSRWSDSVDERIWLKRSSDPLPKSVGDPIWLEGASDPLPKSVDQKLLEASRWSDSVDQKLLETSRLSDSVDDRIWLKRASDPLPKSVDQKVLETSRLSDSVDQKVLETNRFSDSVDMKLRKLSGFSSYYDMKLRKLSGFSSYYDDTLSDKEFLFDYDDDRIWIKRASDPLPKSVDQKLSETCRLSDLVDEKLHKTSRLSDSVDDTLSHEEFLLDSDDEKLQKTSRLSDSVDEMSRYRGSDVISVDKKLRKLSGLSKSVEESSIERGLDEMSRYRGSDVISVDDTSSVEEFLLDSDGKKIRHKASDVLSKSVDDTLSHEEFLLDSYGKKIRHKASDVLSKSLEKPQFHQMSEQNSQ